MAKRLRRITTPADLINPLLSRWWQSRDPAELLDLVPNTSDRKLRLFAIACAHQLLQPGMDREDKEVCCRALDAAEKLADGLVGPEEVTGITLAMDLVIGRRQHARFNAYPVMVERTCRICLDHYALGAALWAASAALQTQQHVDSRARQVDRLREIIPDPYIAHTYHPEWDQFRDGIIVKLAQSTYDDRDFTIMPILGDALEDAGCTDDVILRHCREPGQHVRGCWLLDLILRKE